MPEFLSFCYVLTTAETQLFCGIDFVDGQVEGRLCRIRRQHKVVRSDLLDVKFAIEDLIGEGIASRVR